MYTSFFGLRCRPFQLTPDPDFLFMSEGHKKTLTYLTYGISESQSFIMLSGEVGTGKTTLIRKILKTIPAEVNLAKVTNTRVSSEQLIALINEDFGLDTTGKDKIRLLNDLTGFLIEQYAQGRRCMLIVDEAQNLSPGLLEDVRLLSNIETDKSKLLQIVLVGQPELINTLARPEMRQLRQRINVNCHISPLSEKETGEYIHYRLQNAGNRDAAEFESGCVGLIYGFSRGIPRLINIACDFIFLAAFAAGTRRIEAGLVSDVLGELEEENAYWSDKGPAEDSPGLILMENAGHADAGEHKEAAPARPAPERSFPVHKAMSDSIERFAKAVSAVEASQKKTEERLEGLAREVDLIKRASGQTQDRQALDGGARKKSPIWRRIFD